MVLEKTLESPLDCKEIQPVNPKGNQSWIFIGRTDTEAPKLWSHDVKRWLIGKDPAAGKDWRQKEKVGRAWDGWIASPTQWTWLSKLWEIVKDREPWCAAAHGVIKSWTWLSDWTTTTFVPTCKKSIIDYKKKKKVLSLTSVTSIHFFKIFIGM